MYKINKRVKLKDFLMLVSIFLTILTMTVSLALIYSAVMRYSRGMTDSINRSEFEYTVSAVEREYNNLINISNSIKNNNKLKDSLRALKSGDTDVYSQIIENNYITDFLIGLKNSSKLIESISIVSDYKRFYTLDYLISYDLAGRLKDEAIEGIKFCYPENSESNEAFVNRNYLLDSLDEMVHIKFRLEDDTSFYGNVYMLLNSSLFSKMVEEKENLLIYNNEGTILYSSIVRLADRLKDRNADTFIKELESGGAVSVYKQTLGNGWTIACIIENTVFSGTKQVIWAMLLLCIIAGAVFSAVLSKWLSKSILRPVLNLMDFLSGYSYGKEEYRKYDTNTSKGRMSLRIKIFYYLLATAVIPVLIFVLLFYAQSMYWIKGQILNQYDITFRRTAKYTDKYIEGKSAAFQNLIYDISVQKFLFESSQRDDAVLKEPLSDYKYLGLEDNEISFWDMENKLIFSNYTNGTESMDKDIILALQDLKQGSLWFYSRNEMNRNMLVLGSKVMAISVPVYKGGPLYARLNVPLSDVISIFENLKTNASQVFISDYSGRDITSEFSESIFIKQQEDISGNIDLDYDRKKARVFFHRINKTPWLLVAKYDYGDISEQGFNIFANNIYIIIILVLMIVVISYFLSLFLLKPVNIFNSIMENYRLDDVSADMMVDSFIYEIDSLGISFNKMIERIEDLFDSLLIANKEKNQLKFQIKAAEMVALQAQINPHFLYNTLNNLIYLIDDGQKEKANKVVSSLVKLFRFGISRGDRIIAISEEIAYAKAYADIITIRYGEAISFEWDICEELLEHRTLKLILQPLMENSVFHGFKDKTENCRILVKCFRKEGKIKFYVSDNGMGITEENLDEIRKGLASDNIEERVGIYNVQARIRLQYGREYGVALDSNVGVGTTISITLPEDENGL